MINMSKTEVNANSFLGSENSQKTKSVLTFKQEKENSLYNRSMNSVDDSISSFRLLKTPSRMTKASTMRR